MVQFLLIRPGSTDFDEQGRIKGTLNLPLSEVGALQVGRIVGELHDTRIDHLYTSPCQSAAQTAAAVAIDHRLRAKVLDELQNLDHGLWQGKLIDELKQGQPKVFRQLQEHPETVCPPQGEPVGAALERARNVVQRLLRKHKSGTIALVVPEPLASLVQSVLCHCTVGDLWEAECECGAWRLIDVPAAGVAVAG
jgi:broad specificity phosphatase PhoE